jgi:EAL domain-containing protein (putative c-di-GMP-specific phosphodiesterase class I)
LSVTAEGIETADQLERLRALGCDLGQGSLLGRPANAEAAEAMLVSSFAIATEASI